MDPKGDNRKTETSTGERQRRVIKRYSNRKLYDTAAKRYVTLDGIAELIRQGAEVRVIDHATGDDMTAQIQAQIIFEEEKRGGGLLPRTT